jgi:hypothetical protein
MDTNKAEEKMVETETTQVESPTTESPITGDQTAQEETVDQVPSVETSDVPTDIEEQRRAFQEMRIENKRLKEEIESGKSGQSAFTSLRPQTPPVGNIQPVRIENFQDSITGETNWSAYNNAMQVREQQILAQARSEAARVTEELVDEQTARNKHPDLFNDKTTEKLIAGRWLFEKMQGNNMSVTQIAEEFARNYKQAVSKAEKIGAEKILNEVTEKEKAGLSASGQTSQPARVATSQEEAQNLSARTRMGDKDAVAARLSKIPWANK